MFENQNLNLEDCVPFTKHIPAQEAMRAAGGAGTICVRKVAQPVPVGSPLESVQYACKKHNLNLEN